MDWLSLVIQLLAGAAGGHGAGALMKNANLNGVLKTVIGAIGGVGGGQLAGLALGGGAAVAEGATPGMGLGEIITQIIAGGVGGGVLTGIIGMVMKGAPK